MTDPQEETRRTPPVFYEFVGRPEARIRDDSDGQPLLLPDGAGDNATGQPLALTQADIEALVDAGVLRRQPPNPVDLAAALAGHVGDLRIGTLDDLATLCQVSPNVAAHVYSALTDTAATRR
jgi:hypothetical protein